MNKLIAENHDVKCGFIITEVEEGVYYYFEYDELEDVEGANEDNKDLYITREKTVYDLMIANFKADYDEIDDIAEIVETIGFNDCHIRDLGIDRDELDSIIKQLQTDSNI